MPEGRKSVLVVLFGYILAALCIGVLPATGQQSEQQPQQPPVNKPETTGQSDPQQTTHLSDEGKKGSRVFGVMPNQLTVEGAKKVSPIAAGEKFKLVAEGAFDPYEFITVGVLAGIGQATNDTPEWGQGAKGYGIRYGTDFGDQIIGNFMVGAVLPSVFHQDPRYFQSGKGSFARRFGYALSRVAVTRGDSGKTQFNISEIAGNGIAGVISNTYHPPSERTFGQTSQTWATQMGVDAIGFELKEFWPDIRRKFSKKK
ncbi:MAG TPA: hypothetical protein VGP19_14865 [Candidatus Acidoferrales bacterium]|jgi:hypothetical protein|nr:hypothetical protein [Candidatus Acidoferrales bacterium]